MKTTTLLTLLLCAGLFCSLNSYGNTYYWVSTGSPNSNWSTLANWKLPSCSGSTPTSLPGTGDSVVFSGSCSTNNCTIDVAINVLSVRVDGVYTGTISQSSGNAVTIAIGKFTGGTFTGSNATITITTFTINGGTFTATSGSTTLKGNFSFTAGTFNHNNGRVVFYTSLTVSGTSSPTFYDAEFQAIAGNTTITLSKSITVSDSTLLTGSNQLFINSSNSSVINADGDIKIYNTSGTGGGTATIDVNGSSTQHITGNATTKDVGKLPNLTINSTGTVYLIGYITMGSSTTLAYTAGTINAGTSDLIFYYDNTITGSMAFNNVEFQGTNSGNTISNTITVNGNVYITGTGPEGIFNGTINLYGNAIVSNTSIGDEGTTVINFLGAGNDSIIASSGVTLSEGCLPSISINKSGGALYLIGNISIANNWTNNYSTSNINPGTSNLYFFSSNAYTIGGTYSTPVWNVQFLGYSNSCTLGKDSALIIRNNLTYIGTQGFRFFGHSINLYGNAIVSNTSSGDGGTTVINFLGAGNDSIIASSGVTLSEGCLPSISINKSGGTLYLIGNISIANNLVYVGGTVNAGTSTVGFYTGLSLAATGSSSAMSFNNLEVGSSTVTLGSALNIMGWLTINSSSTLNTSSNNYQIKLAGNWINNGTYTANSADVTFNGSITDSIKGSTNTTFHSLTLNKTGTLTLADPTTVTDSFNLTSGDILTSSTNLLTLNNGSLVTGGSDNSFVNGPIKKIGNSAFTFPTGGDNSYHPIGISAPGSTSDAFTAQYFYLTPAGRTHTDDSLTYISACDYWLLSHPAGSSTITATLGWGTNSCNIDRLSSLRVGYYNTTTHDWTNLGQSATIGTTSSGSVTATTALSISTTADTFAISKHSPTPTVSAGTNTTICYGTGATIGGSPTATGGYSPYTYSWSPATALSSSTAANPTASPTATTTYTVTVEDDDNAPTATGTVVVTVNNKCLLTINGNGKHRKNVVCDCVPGNQ